MSCRTLVDEESGQACFYCSTTDWAFGPIFSSREAAELFLKVHAEDPRNDTDAELRAKFYDFTHEYVCECGELKDEDNAERMANIAYPQGCNCENNGDYCDWCKAKMDILESGIEADRFQCSYCWLQSQEKLAKVVAR